MRALLTGTLAGQVAVDSPSDDEVRIVLSGAAILSLTSVISKSIVPGTIFPIGIITALVGVPFLFSLIMSTRRRAW